MRFEFEPSFGEQFQATVAVMLRNRMQVAGAAVFALAGFFLLLITLVGIQPLDVRVLVIPFCFLWVPFIAAVNVWSARRKNRLVAGVHVWSMDAEGIRISGPMFDTTIKWQAVRRVVETKRFFLFFFSANAANMLPKRAVPSERFAEVRRLVATCQTPSAAN